MIEKKTDLSNYKSIITSKNSKPYYNKLCEESSLGSISLLNAQCVTNFLKKRSSCLGIFDFTSEDFIENSIISGFGSPEKNGRWTIKEDATFFCNMDQKNQRRVIINLIPFQNKTVSISFNNSLPLKKNIFNISEPSSISISIPKSQNNKNLKIKFHIHNPQSPSDLNMSDDKRLLGIMIKTIKFE